MEERRPLTPRDEAQIRFEQLGRNGFVEDFIEMGADDLKFTSMSAEDQELWIRIAGDYPSLLDDVSPFTEESK